MRRRAFVRGVGAGSVAGVGTLAGCLSREDDDDNDESPEEPSGGDDGVLRIATYSSLVTGDEPAGAWLRETFEEAHEDAEIEWRVPEAGIEHFIRRGELEAEIGADVYLGVTAADLVRVDDALGEGALFAPLERGQLSNDRRVRAELAFDDPADRAIPFGTAALSLVYDGTELEGEPPTSFDALLEEEYGSAVLAQDPRTSTPGLGFLLWTIAEYGDDYLEYWRDLRANGLVVHKRWTDAYRRTYLRRERPIVVSYATDRVGAVDAGRELDRHRIATLDREGFQLTEGVAVFADSPRAELAHEFVDFVLSGDAQAELARRNVQLPAIEDEYVDLDETVETYADEPSETVTTSYDDLRGDLENWLEAWDEEFGEDWPVERPPPLEDDEDAEGEGEGDEQDADSEEEADEMGDGDDGDGDGEDDEDADDDTTDETDTPATENTTESGETTDYVG